MGRHQTQGQIFIFVIILLIGLLVVYGLLSALSSRGRAAPLVKETTWLVDDIEVSKANLGEEVGARVVITAIEQYEGSIVVKIRKDVSMWFDSDFHVSTIPVDLVGDEEKTMEITFTPDQASGGGWGGLRGYFIEIEFRATRTTWEMENTYPPRLKVTD